MAKTLYRREFLNLDRQGTGGGMAAIRIKEGELSISDCNRTVSLEFYVDDDYYDRSHVDNVEYKLDTLKSMVDEFTRYTKAKIKRARKLNA